MATIRAVLKGAKGKGRIRRRTKIDVENSFLITLPHLWGRGVPGRLNNLASGALVGHVAIVTGARRSPGRAHAVTLAAESAAVVVNDLGGDLHRHEADATPTHKMVAEIVKAGGMALVCEQAVPDRVQAGALASAALDTFGRMDVLFKDAGILSDKLFASISEVDWDAVIRTHLTGHAAPFDQHWPMSGANCRLRNHFSGQPSDRMLTLNISSWNP